METLYSIKTKRGRATVLNVGTPERPSYRVNWEPAEGRSVLFKHRAMRHAIDRANELTTVILPIPRVIDVAKAAVALEEAAIKRLPAGQELDDRIARLETWKLSISRAESHARKASIKVRAPRPPQREPA